MSFTAPLARAPKSAGPSPRSASRRPPPDGFGSSEERKSPTPMSSARWASGNTSKSTERARKSHRDGERHQNARLPSNSPARTHYKNHLDVVSEENKALKARVELLERENKELKQSVYNLSYLYNLCSAQLNDLTTKTNDGAATPAFQRTNTFDLHAALSSSENDVTKFRSEERDDTGLKTHADKGTKALTKKFDLNGHEGSVYTCAFSPCGKWLASGSFDKTVRLWSMAAKEQVSVFNEHHLNVSDLSWTGDSAMLLSGAYDRSVKVWDVATGKLLRSFDTAGFVQSVEIDHGLGSVFYVGCTQKQILGYDFRSGKRCREFELNDAMVNSLCVMSEDNMVLSGDGHGALKLWSTNTGTCVKTMENESAHKPISHVHALPLRRSADAEEECLVAVNSFDNVLRVYSQAYQLSQLSGQETQAEKAPLQLRHELRSHKNKNWPIKSAFYQGSNYRPDDEVERGTNQNKENGFQDTVTLATGSADGNVYLFDVGGPGGSAKMVQKLKGHKDAVYAVDFNPQKLAMASASADFSVKVWGPSSGEQKRYSSRGVGPRSLNEDH